MSERTYWKTPGGKVWKLYEDMAKQTHLLVAGSTGSGKSVLVNGILYTVLHDSPSRTELILLDPKRTELFDYKDLPHVLRYACEPVEIVSALNLALDIMDRRLKYMQANHLKFHDGSDIYLVIDELAYLLINMKKQTKPLVQRLLTLGRCCRIHLISCTQVVNVSVIPTEVRCNYTGICGLKTATKMQSRLMVDVPGCESFPEPRFDHKAYCYYRRGTLNELYSIPMIPQEDIDRICKYWTSSECIA